MIPIIGPVPQSPRYPRRPIPGRHVFDTMLSYSAGRLWLKHFGPTMRKAPLVYLGRYVGRKSLVHARCVSWGIIISRRYYQRTTNRAMNALLLHELCHWAGWVHGPNLRRVLKAHGGTY